MLRKSLDGFVGNPNDREVQDAICRKAFDVLSYCVKTDILAPGHSVVASTSSFDGMLHVEVLPPNGQLPEKFRDNNLGTGLTVAVSPQHSAPKDAMNNQDYIARVAQETGIDKNRLLIEGCSPSVVSLDVLNGTEDERWAATAALEKLLPAGVNANRHMRELADNKCCRECGSRMKFMETFSKKTGTTSKSKCSNPLCKNGKYWMPSYRPRSTKPEPARMVFSVDHGYDLGSDEEPKVKGKPIDWTKFSPPDKMTVPQFKNPPPHVPGELSKIICETEPLTTASGKEIRRDQAMSTNFATNYSAFVGEVAQIREKIIKGLDVPEEYLKGSNYSTAEYAEKYHRDYADFSAGLLKRTQRNLTGVKTGRVSSSQPNQAMPPQEDWKPVKGMCVRNEKTSEVGELHEYKYTDEPSRIMWMVTINNFSHSRTRLLSEGELKQDGWVPSTRNLAVEHVCMGMVPWDGSEPVDGESKEQSGWPSDKLGKEHVGTRLIEVATNTMWVLCHKSRSNSRWNVENPNGARFQFTEATLRRRFRLASNGEDPKQS